MSAVRPLRAARGDARTRLPTTARLLLAMLSCLDWGRITVFGPDGFREDFGNRDGLQAQIQIREWSACGAILRDGDIGFAESYMQGHWDTPDLVALLTVAAHNQRALDRGFYGSVLRRVAMRILHGLRRNTRAGARRNIAAHYDLGNAFYRLWLDESMTYSSGLFEHASQSLAAAQSNKYRRILRELDLQPGQHVLEIGAGWGGFAEEALRAHPVRLTGLSLSRAQTAFANDRVRRLGFAGRGAVFLRDYRDEPRTYDAVVSIEMFEAVGERYWPLYFERIRRALRPHGRAVIQAITIAEDRFERYRAASDFIQQYIFPGGMLATKSRMADEAAAAGLRLESRYDFGGDYGRTLLRWLESFDREERAIRSLGFDTRFIRMWRFYLAYCVAGFASATTDVSQFTLVG